MMTTTTKAPNTNLCLCGCGAQVTKTFAQGHDARLRGSVLRAARGAAPAPVLAGQARAWLRSAHWMTPELAQLVAMMPSA